MTRTQAKRLRTLITRKVKADVALSWKGSKMPEGHQAIEGEYKKATTALNKYIDLLVRQQEKAKRAYLESIGIK